MRASTNLGDGDRCPIVPEHGAMMTMSSAPSEPRRQWCPHQSHDGLPKSAPGGPTPRTRSIWPLDDKAFEEAKATLGGS